MYALWLLVDRITSEFFAGFFFLHTDRENNVNEQLNIFLTIYLLYSKY